MMMKENEDYELIPGTGENWDVRLLEGPCPETVISFSKLRVSEDEEHLTFSFDIVSSPDPDLTEENVDLQLFVGEALASILETAVERTAEGDKS
jgi:hypothetical protein